MRWSIIFYLEDFPGIRTVGNMSKKKLTALIAVPALSFSLVACSDSGEDAAPETITEEITATPTASTASDDDGQSEQDDDQDDHDDQQKTAGNTQGDRPAEVTGYTAEAEAEKSEEGVTDSDVESTLAAARNNEAGVEIEWDDGYWEIEFGDIEIDIDPGGLVRDIDRDD